MNFWKKVKMKKEKSKVRLKGLIENLSKKNNRLNGILLIRWLIEAVLIVGLAGYLFYNSVKAAFIMSPYIILHIRLRNKAHIGKCREKEIASFKDGIRFVNNSMHAGYSIENSFKEALIQMEQVYGKDNDTYKGFKKVVGRVMLNIPIEQAFYQYAVESATEEIMDFAEILKYAKRSGGNMSGIINNTANIITEKISLKQEISTVIAGKKFEQMILSVVPAGIIFYMRVSSFGTIEKLYGNLFGIIVMSVCLFIYIVSVITASRISLIKI